MKSYRATELEAHTETRERDSRARVVGAANPTPVRTLRDVEEAHVRYALSVYNGNKKRAAEALGISRDTLYRKLAEFGSRRPVVGRTHVDGAGTP